MNTTNISQTQRKLTTYHSEFTGSKLKNSKVPRFISFHDSKKMQSYKIQGCKVATIATTKYSMLEKLQDYKFACYVVAGL